MKNAILKPSLLGILLVSGSASAASCNTPENGFGNCSFELGTLQDWVRRDLSAPYRALQAAPAGVTDMAFSSFASTPTDGVQVALTGFDGNGPGTIQLAQDIVLDPAATNLTFDYRAGWDLVPYGATANRLAVVEVQNPGGNRVLSRTVYLTANAGTTVNDTGALTGSIDVSPYAGEYVRIVFKWEVPQSFTGPALFQLDNVHVAGVNRPFHPFNHDVPALSFWALALLSGLLGLYGWKRLNHPFG